MPFAGARKAGKDLDVKVPELGAQSESDINGQISILENAVSEKPAAIVIAPTQFKALGQPINEAAKQTKIIEIGSAADSKAFTSFLQTDNVQGGRVAADGLAAAIAAKFGKPEGDVALITPIPGVGSLDERAKGFKDEIAAKYPGLKLVADKIADGMATTGLNIMTDLITANPNLRGVFASNGTMAEGAGQAIAENKIADKIKLVGFDSDDKLVKLLSDGTIAALVVQDPYRMGLDVGWPWDWTFDSEGRCESACYGSIRALHRDLPTLQCCLKLSWSNRLAEVVIHPRGKALFAVSLHGVGRQSDNVERRLPRAR
jgi:ribose transport system substrate-binding protein